MSTLGDVVQRQQKQYDNAKTGGAVAGLVSTMTELSAGEKGFLRRKLGDTMTPEFMKSNMDAFDAEVEKQKAALSNDVQRAEFETRVKNELRPAHSRSILNHQMQEGEKYKDVVADAQVKSFANLARSNPFDFSTVRAGAESTRAALINHLMDKGITDKTALQAATDETMGKFHLGVAESMKELNNPQAANMYLDANKDDMAPAIYEKAKSQLQDVLAFSEGSKVASEAFQVLQSTGSHTEAEATLNKIQDPTARRAAELAFNGMRVAQERDYEQAYGGALIKFQRDGGGAQALEQIVGSPEYLGLPRDRQGKLLEHVMSMAQMKLAREDAALNRADARQLRELRKAEDAQRRLEESPEVRSRMAAYTADPDAFAAMTDQEIIAKQSEIGLRNADKLLSLRNAQRQIGKSARLDNDIEAAALDDVPKKDRAVVKSLIQSKFLEWHAAHPGSVPTIEDQKRIALTGQEEWKKTGFFGTSEVKAYEVKADDIAYPAWMENVFPKLTNESRAKAYRQISTDPAFVSKMKTDYKELAPEEALRAFVAEKAAGAKQTSKPPVEPTPMQKTSPLEDFKKAAGEYLNKAETRKGDK
jgi:predicted double-glycine peptidase